MTKTILIIFELQMWMLKMSEGAYHLMIRTIIRVVPHMIFLSTVEGLYVSIRQ